jgi:hypothetical protein
LQRAGVGRVEGHGDREGDAEGDGDREGDGEGDGDREGDGEGDGDREGDGEGDGDREGDGEGDGDREGDGDGEGDGEGDGDGEADRGAGERDVPGDAVRSVVGPSAEGADAPGGPDAGAGLPVSDDRPPGGPGAAPGVEKLPPPSARVVAWTPCGPPASSSTAIPPATTAAATAPVPATAPGYRRTSCHHRGPAGTIGFGNPARSNGSARCATLTR